ncbi:MAG: proline racemase family protein [Armatimonadota bacterium]|nr:proline racemase family protein [Armatimonadota bacterium]
MNASQVLIAVDAHAGGDPMRVLVAGGPVLRGATVAHRMAHCAETHDWLRRALILEPRGHADMMGAVLTPPALADADFGVFFMHAAGYLPMCGHGTLALITALAQVGSVPWTAGEARAVFDTPAGAVQARAVRTDAGSSYAEVVNVPSVALDLDVRLTLADGRAVLADIAYAGNAYVIVEAGQLGLDVEPGAVAGLKEAWREIRDAANSQLHLRHPFNGAPLGPIDLVQFFGPPRHPRAHARNVVICSGQISRSPCGTGTCARAAALWARGALRPGGEFVNEGMAGMVFSVRPMEEVRTEGRSGIIPLLTGEAYLTAIHQFVVDPEDPFRYGLGIDH